MRFFKKRNIFSKIKNYQKSLITFFLSANLLIATGSGQLNIATDSANLQRESSSSASASPSANPVPTPAIAAMTDDVLVSKNLPLSTKVDPSGQFFEDELSFVFKENVPDETKRNILKENNLIIKRDLKKTKVKIVQVDPAKRDQVLANLQSNPNIKYAQLSYGGRLHEGGGGGLPPGPNCSPNDPFYCAKMQWGLDLIHAANGWAVSKGSSSVTVAVMDTGIAWNHLDLGLNNITPGGTATGRVVRGMDVTQPDGFFNTSIDTDGHGTQVAGILGAKTNNAQNIAAVDWYAKLVAIKLLGPGGQMFNADLMAEAILEAIDPSTLNHYPDYQAYTPPPAKVINISSGLCADVRSVKDAVNQALAQGVIIVAAVNNSALDCLSPIPPQDPKDCFIGFPAAYPGVISVVGVDWNGKWAIGCMRYTKEGITYQPVQIAAPGQAIWTLTRGLIDTVLISGTSFAAPHVSGVASVLAGCVPGGSASLIKRSLLNNATYITDIPGVGFVSFASVLMSCS